jgi:rare lipoprotein A
MARPEPSIIEAGIASWYGPGFHGRMTADGSIFDQNAMTAAHPWLPLGSIIEVYCLCTNRAVRVRITDRGPYINGRIIDLSMAAAQRLGMLERGVAVVGVFQ